MSVTVMKMYSAEQKPSIVHYRKFKDFCNDSFIKDTELLLSKLSDEQNVPFKILKESVNITLDKHCTIKEKICQSYSVPFYEQKIERRNYEKVTLEKQVFKYKK